MSLIDGFAEKREKADLFRMWREHFTGKIDFRKLVVTREERQWGLGAWVECPCGGEDHCGWIPYVDHVANEGRTFGEVLTCFVTGKQWLVGQSISYIAGCVREEEEAYAKVLKRAPGIVAKVVKRRGWSLETLTFLKDTHGIDADIATEEAVAAGLIEGKNYWQ